MTNSLTPDRRSWRAPKVLLHDHLDGGRAARGPWSSWPRRPATTGLPDHRRGRARRAGSCDAADSGSLERYLETFAHTVGVMQTPEALAGWPRECAQDLAADGVVYAEVRFAPELHVEPRAWSCRRSSRRSTRASARGERLAAAAGTRSGSARCSPRCGTRPARWRSPSWRSATATTGVVGFDIAGAEAGYPPTRHLDAFEYLQRENAHFTIHAGEGFGLPSIWQAIQWCGADRLGHGVRIIDDITVGPDGDGATLGRLAAYVRDKRIPLEMARPPTCMTGAAQVDRGAPDRAAAPAAASGSPSTPTTG